MSMSLLKPNRQPKLWHRWEPRGGSAARSIEVWITTCIVTNFADADCSTLINPSNPQLSGVQKFSYFPRGGPVPSESLGTMHKDWQPLGHVSSWGGMEVGSGMMYPVSVVDGLVHQWGGWKLAAECRMRQIMAEARMVTAGGRGGGGGADACPYGQAVVTSSGNGKLREKYDWIVHTATPFYKHHANPESCLRSCYQNALRVSIRQTGSGRIATALLGAGCKGFPQSVAMEIAANAATEWYTKVNREEEEEERMKQTGASIVFGLLEEAQCDAFSSLLETRLSI